MGMRDVMVWAPWMKFSSFATLQCRVRHVTTEGFWTSASVLWGKMYVNTWWESLTSAITMLAWCSHTSQTYSYHFDPLSLCWYTKKRKTGYTCCQRPHTWLRVAQVYGINELRSLGVTNRVAHMMSLGTSWYSISALCFPLCWFYFFL